MTDPVYRSDIVVLLDESCGSDRAIARRAWVEKPGETSNPERDGADGWRRVLRAMLKGRHGSPFEGGYLSVYVEAPVVVWWEWSRHRFMSMGCPDLGFNLESGRYRLLDGEFYLPPPERPCAEPEGFRPMRPLLVTGTNEHELTTVLLRDAYLASWQRYQQMTVNGVAREVARLALGFGLYYAGYISANPRTWLQFFSLRRKDERSSVASYPQWEIEQADLQCETLFARYWPITYELFNELGRHAPGA